MSLAQKFTSLTTYEYLSKTREGLLGKSDSIGTEQIGAIRRSLETSITDLQWNRGRDGRTVERVTPKELGYDFPEVPWVFIGDCGAIDKHYAYDFGGIGGAHTHMCRNDSLRRCFCISDQKFIFDEMMWHEYAHALMKFPEIVSMKCIGKKNLHDIKFVNVKSHKEWNYGHSQEWRELILSFGYPDRLQIPMWEVPDVTW